MNKLNTLFLIILIFLSLLALRGVKSNEEIEAKSNTSSIQSGEQIEAKKIDQRAQILSAYLAKHNSPMQFHAQDFIDAANTYRLDWKMLPAIAGVESTFGKSIPGGYNAYGWGVYGTQAIYFKSWRDGMFIVAKGLRENYLDKGLNDPYSMNRVYAASPFWGGKVTYFMNELEKFAKEYEQAQGETVSLLTTLKVAANSGELALFR